MFLHLIYVYISTNRSWKFGKQVYNQLIAKGKYVGTKGGNNFTFRKHIRISLV